MAIVVDEFGTAIGMITMEDIVEEVVGEIDVGYDFEEYLPKRKRVYERLAEEVYLMDSRSPISEANEVLRTMLPTTEFHTVGGLVLARLRHIPKEGEFIVGRRLSLHRGRGERTIDHQVARRTGIERGISSGMMVIRR